MSTKPSIVFAHGLWADGSCYSKVIKLLQADGFEVIATQNQLNTVEDDAAAVRTSFNRVSSPIVLVGHSYGGTVITVAGTDERVGASTSARSLPTKVRRRRPSRTSTLGPRCSTISKWSTAASG